LTREYSPKERVLAAYKRKYADRVPVFPLVGHFSAKLAGISIKEFELEPAKMAEAIIKYYELFNPDVVTAFSDLWLEAEAAGDEIEFPEEATCYIKKYVLEEKSTLAKLNVPDPKKDKRMPDFLEACERIVSVIKDREVAPAASGPCTIAMCMRSPEEFINDTFDDPGFVHELMRFSTELTKKLGDALKEIGLGASMGDPSASCSCISPEIYREFVKPYHQELIDYFGHIPIHICGYIDPLMEELTSLGFSAISIDETSSLKKMVEVSRKRVVVTGNVAPYLLVDGTKEQIEDAVRECIKIAAKGSAFVLATGCEVAPETPVENLKCFIEAANKWGSYEQVMAL
jgi:uroporphyrinogen decarboxylase